MSAAAKDRGADAYRNGRFEEAVRHFTEAIDLASPTDDIHVYHSNRCASLQQLKRWSAALDDAEAATQIKPGWAKGWVRLGTCLDALGRRNEGEAAWQKAAELDPSSARSRASARGNSSFAPAEYWIKAVTWFQGLDEQYRLGIMAAGVALILFAIHRMTRGPRYDEYYYDPRGQYYGGGGGGGVGLGGLGLLMAAAWKLPPLFGHPPFFGMSPVTALMLLRSFTGGGGGGFHRPFGFGGGRRRHYY